MEIIDNEMFNITKIKDIESYNLLNDELSEVVIIGENLDNRKLLPITPEINPDGTIDIELDFYDIYENIINKYKTI
jgi:hypothetical protein